MGKVFKTVAKIALPIAGNFIAPGIGAAVGGAAAGALGGGGIKGALLGGLGGYAGSSLLGSAAGSPLSGGIGPTQGSGVLGALTGGGTKALTGALGGGAFGGGTSSYLSPLLSAGIGTYSNDKAAKELLKQQKANQALLTPFTTASFNPGDLTQDPGYQFQLSEGTKALANKQAASGNYFSGQALKEAQDYGQGLAGTTYDDAYKRFIEGQQQKLGAAGALAGVNDNIGNIQGSATVNNGNVLTGSLASILGGQGISNTGALTGNNDIYQLLARMRQGAYA